MTDICIYDLDHVQKMIEEAEQIIRIGQKRLLFWQHQLELLEAQ